MQFRTRPQPQATALLPRPAVAGKPARRAGGKPGYCHTRTQSRLLQPLCLPLVLYDPKASSRGTNDRRPHRVRRPLCPSLRLARPGENDWLTRPAHRGAAPSVSIRRPAGPIAPVLPCTRPADGRRLTRRPTTRTASRPSQLLEPIQLYRRAGREVRPGTPLLHNNFIGQSCRRQDDIVPAAEICLSSLLAGSYVWPARRRQGRTHVPGRDCPPISPVGATGP